VVATVRTSLDNSNWVLRGAGQQAYNFNPTFTCRYIYINIDAAQSDTITFYEAYFYGLSTSSIITQALNFGFIPANLGNIAAQLTLPTGTAATLQTRTSVDGLTWDSWLDAGLVGENNGIINSTARQYLEWKAILNSDVLAASTPTLHQGYVGASWRSVIHDLGAAPASWGKFEAIYSPNGQTITFWMRSAATSGGIAAATWYQQTPGLTVASVTLNQYIQVEIRFNTTDYTQIPLMNSFQINYYTATNLLSPCSAVWKKDYWLNVVDAGQTVNNIVWVYNLAGFWLKRTNKKNNVYFIDEDKLLSGTSSSDGFVRENDAGTKDDTTDIDSWFETPKMRIESFVKMFRKYRLTHKSGASWTFSYKIDDGAYTDVTITAVTYAETINKIFAGITSGKYIQLKFRQSAEDGNWEIHALELFYQNWRELSYE
jgi:hypothetical protein